MNERTIILEMLKMQQSLNDETNGLGWENGYTNKNKLISWRRCIYMECAELIDSFAWKHWKSIDAKTDEQNLRIEVVDIWHFIMSLALQIYKSKQLGGIEALADDICQASGFSDFCKEPLSIEDESIYEIMNDVEMLYSLYECYIAKNVLNRFRQNNGYKEGSYKKNWNGREDNEVMSEILSNGVSTIDEIYAALEHEYKKVR